LPEFERSKKMVDQEVFLRERIAKVSDQLKKQREEIANVINHYIHNGEFNSNLISKKMISTISHLLLMRII
jgi:hypothetical protein